MLFLTDLDLVSFEKANETRQNSLQSATVSLQVVIGLCKRKETAIRQHPINFPTLRITVSSLNESKETIRAAERAEAAYERKMYRYKAQYSLDCENGIENAVLLKPQTPEECHLNDRRRHGTGTYLFRNVCQSRTAYYH